MKLIHIVWAKEDKIYIPYDFIDIKFRTILWLDVRIPEFDWRMEKGISDWKGTWKVSF